MNLSDDRHRLVIDELVVDFDPQGRGRPVLDGVSVTVEPGEIVTVLGPSGCGKTTLLSTIAGLITPTSGSIRLGERTLFEGGRGVPAHDRGLGMMFQSYALWPHMTVTQNVAFPLTGRLPKAQHAAAVTMALEMVECAHLAARYPGELSGGQQQRVALARALVGDPTVILFDEPLSNLDVALRHSLRAELAALHNRLGFTGVYVTHDQAEGFHLAHQVVILDQGRVVQAGRPEAVYRAPASELVARFLGANVIAGTVERTLVDASAALVLRTAFGLLPVPAGTPPGPARVAVYPGDLRLTEPGALTTAIGAVGFVGSGYEVLVQAGDQRVTVLHTGRTAPMVGEAVAIDAPAEAVHLLT